MAKTRLFSLALLILLAGCTDPNGPMPNTYTETGKTVPKYFVALEQCRVVDTKNDENFVTDTLWPAGCFVTHAVFSISAVV